MILEQTLDRATILRDEFPIFQRKIHGKRLVYLDNAASSQKPEVVLRAMDDYYRQHNSNVHRGVHTLSEEATALYEGARTRIANFINAPSAEQIIFTRGTTEGINLVAYSWGRANLGPGDEVLSPDDTRCRIRPSADTVSSTPLPDWRVA